MKNRKSLSIDFRMPAIEIVFRRSYAGLKLDRGLRYQRVFPIAIGTSVLLSLQFAVFRPGCIKQLAGEADIFPRDAPRVHAKLATGLGYIRWTLQRCEARF